MGAKSSSLLVETPDLKMLIDPGASEMQPPASRSQIQRADSRIMGVSQGERKDLAHLRGVVRTRTCGS